MDVSLEHVVLNVMLGIDGSAQAGSTKWNISLCSQRPEVSPWTIQNHHLLGDTVVLASLAFCPRRDVGKWFIFGSWMYTALLICHQTCWIQNILWWDGGGAAAAMVVKHSTSHVISHVIKMSGKSCPRPTVCVYHPVGEAQISHMVLRQWVCFCVTGTTEYKSLSGQLYFMCYSSPTLFIRGSSIRFLGPFIDLPVPNILNFLVTSCHFYWWPIVKSLWLWLHGS